MAQTRTREVGPDELGRIHLRRRPRCERRHPHLHVSCNCFSSLRPLTVGSDYVGYNRHGEHLLEAVTKAACFSDDELESLVTLWVEQAKTGMWFAKVVWCMLTYASVRSRGCARQWTEYSSLPSIARFVTTMLTFNACSHHRMQPCRSRSKSRISLLLIYWPQCSRKVRSPSDSYSRPG